MHVYVSPFFTVNKRQFAFLAIRNFNFAHNLNK